MPSNNNDAELMQMMDEMAMGGIPPEANLDVAEPFDPNVLGEEIAPENFYENLRSKLDDLDAKKLATELLSLIEKDRDTQTSWLETANELKPYLGYILEPEGDVRSGRKFKTYDTTLSVALDKQVAYLSANILHESGIADYIIVGEIDDAKEELGVKKAAFINHFVTRVDKGYYQDFKKFFTLFAWYGGVAKKIYLDPVTKMPCSRHIDPEDFIFDASCASVATCERVTHTLHLSARDIILKQQTESYDPDVVLTYLANDDIKDDPIESLGKKTKNPDGNSTYTQYETHTYIDIDRLLNKNRLDINAKVTLPEPYIITIDATMKDIVSIRRNWKFDDKDKNKKDFFLYYIRKQGFDNMGCGLAHDIGANCIALSKIQGLTIDAAILKNNPSGFTSVRMKEQDAMQDQPPGTWRFCDTSPASARDAFFSPPYTGADVGLIELGKGVLAQTQEAAATSSLNVAEMKDNTPVGTTMIRSQEDSRLRDAISQSFCDYLREELSMLEKLFAESLEYQEFSFGKQKFSISAEDFGSEDVVLVPMHNPANNSATHRMIRAQELMRLSREAPGMTNEKELFKMNCEALQLSPQEIEKIMTPESNEQEVVPLDPITENMNLMMGKPVVTAVWQNHHHLPLLPHEIADFLVIKSGLI